MSKTRDKLTTIQIEESTHSKPSAIDAAKGVLADVKIVGLSSPTKNREYSPKALKEAIPLYEGVKVNVDHPAIGDKSRRFGDRIGRLNGVYFKEGEGLFAKEFKFNPHHPMANTLVWWAENDANGVGFSQVGGGQTRIVNNRQIVESIVHVKSVDLVADPATTAGLFESEELEGDDVGDLSKVTLAELKESRSDLVDQILAESTRSSEVEGLKKQVADLQESIKVYRDREAKDALTEKARKACKDGKLPQASITDTFVESLIDIDEKRWEKLIEDRRLIAAAAVKPQSQEQREETPIEESEDVAERPEAKKIAARYR